jgi:hypothetical protein
VWRTPASASASARSTVGAGTRRLHLGGWRGGRTSRRDGVTALGLAARRDHGHAALDRALPHGREQVHLRHAPERHLGEHGAEEPLAHRVVARRRREARA